MTGSDTASHRTLDYRPHLDGLRALAVLAVFAFHASPTFLPGGFIGVDVFFVLSGYLITSILLTQLESERPALLRDFYARRVRRLMPAALVLLATVVLVEAVWGSVSTFETRLREVRANLLYVANWNLISQSDDYFAEGVDASPLRHMWSLAVEEQFYFLWPILLVVLYHFGVRRRGLLIVAAVLAVLSAIQLTRVFDPALVSRAYYGTDSRVFQPLLGAILALAVPVGTSRRPALLPRARRHLALVGAAVGLAALAVLSVVLDGSSAWYFDFGAVAVAVAAVVTIRALETSDDNLIGKLLSQRHLVALGTISYGVYLWHWPVIVWFSPPDGSDFLERRLVNVVQFGLTISLAYASFVLIERPIRSGFRLTRYATFGGAAASIVALFVAAGVLLQPPAGSLAAAALDDPSYEPCPDYPHPCVKVDAEGDDPMTLVVIGDSTAQAYDPAFKRLAEKYDFRYVHAALGGCPIGHRLLATGTGGELHKQSNLSCYTHTPDVYREVLDVWDPDLIIATSQNEINRHITDDVIVESGTPEHLEQTNTALTRAVDDLTARGATWVFIDILATGPSVDCLDDSPDGRSGSCVREVPRPAPHDPYNALFAELAATDDHVAGVIDLSDHICPDGACPLVVDDIVTRYDGVHYTGTQSRELAPIIDQQLRDLDIRLDDFTTPDVDA